MSLRINHNLAALNAHRNLVNTNDDLSRSMQRLSSGFRINQGSDDPAGLVISEQFRAQIAGLNQAIENSEGSINMIQTAEGALTEINNLLVSMRELAIHAANEGFNDADQLAADQAEIDNALRTIDRIAANTQFGTKKLLDGSKENVASVTTANASLLTVTQSNLSTGSHFITATKTADPTATLNDTTGGFTLSGTGNDGDPYAMEEKIYNLDVVQSSGAATKTSDNVAITDFWGNGIRLETNANAAVMASAVVMAQATGDTVYDFRINYQEGNSSPTGYVSLNVGVASAGTAADFVTNFNAALVGTALEGKIEASQAGGAVDIKSVNTGAEYSVAWDAVTTSQGQNNLAAIAAGNNRGASTNTFDLSAITAARTSPAGVISTIASGTYSTMDDLAAAMNTALTTAFGDVAGTSTDSDVWVQVFDTNKLQFATRDHGSDYSLQMNAGADATTANLRNVLGFSEDQVALRGRDALVTIDGHSNALSAVDYDQAKEYTLYAGSDTDAPYVKVTVENPGGGLDIGNFLLDVKATKFDVQVDGGPATQVTAGVKTTVYNRDRSESAQVIYDLTSSGGTETINNIDQSLVFQIGANVGQTAAISMRNMSSSALGRFQQGNMFANLSEIDVTSVQGAQDAQGLIDAAINEVTTTRGTLGSFQKNTLESNLRNLRIAAQNLTASESILRDTDMASEMSEFTKNQILVQAGTAMLAQANQIPQIVLSLF